MIRAEEVGAVEDEETARSWKFEPSLARPLAPLHAGIDDVAGAPASGRSGAASGAPEDGEEVDGPDRRSAHYVVVERAHPAVRRR